MNIFKKSAYLFLFIAVLFACNDPNVIGVDLPGAVKFTFSNDSTENIVLNTISEDSLESDQSMYLLLGQINDPIFGENKGSFCQQMLLPANNIDEIPNAVVDSVFITYTYSDFYGDLNESDDLDISVYELSESIYRDSVYYSDETFNFIPQNLATNQFIYEGDSTSSSYLKIQLDNSFGERIIDETGNSSMVDDDAFLDYFKGFYIEATASNTIMYLNPIADKSRTTIYYHITGVDTAVAFNFELGGGACRINLFNTKDSSDLLANADESYLQSMAGHQIEVFINDINSLKNTFTGKAINKATISFDIIEDADYPSHKSIYLFRETESGKIVFLTDFTIEGDEHFGGFLEGNTYTFNITRYFVQLLTDNNYTNKLYIKSRMGAANANRTIFDNTKTSINIIATDL